MKLTTKDMPQEGQFIITWKSNGRIWSDVAKWVEEELFIYSEVVDDWVVMDNYEEEFTNNFMIEDIQFLK